MNALRTFVSESFNKSFYGKRKIVIDFLTVFSISYKSGIKIFLK